jgi:type IV pilus assembly protein PilE
MFVKSRGFSLIEVMITVVIVAVLAAIAYPSYTNHLRKGARAEAKVRLSQIAQLQERHFTEKNTYSDNLATLLGFTSGTTIWSNSNNTTSGYQITVTVPTGAQSFTLSATPQGSQTADSRCGTLKLLSTGKKEITGSGNVAECW